MSEPTPEQPASEPPAGDGQEPKTFDADYVAKLRQEAAKHRTEAKANADAAKRLAEIEEAQKSESEKVADRIAKAEAEVATVPNKVADALRSHLVAIHGIAPERAELYLTATDPELLLKQVAGLVDLESDRKRKTPVVPREGQTSTSVEPEAKALARELFAPG